MGLDAFTAKPPLAHAPLVLQALQRSSGLPVAEIRLDGASCLATIAIDEFEFERRAASRLGAVTNRQVLSALWDSAAGEAADTECQSSLKSSGPFSGPIAPTAQPYAPIGSVQSLSFYGRRSVNQAAEWPPTFERIAFVNNPTADQINLAGNTGVGVAALTVAGDIHFTVTPQPPIVGSTGLFRWWIAELCFASLLKQEPKR